MESTKNIECKVCREVKAPVKFPKRKNPELRRNTCLRCNDRRRLANPDSSIHETIKRRRKGYLSRSKNVPSIIVRSAKFSDKKYGREGFDLDKEFVSILIEGGCFYCGVKDIRMTVDRIDNNIGHSKDNVKPACIRCNNIRGSMPYEAWMMLVPSVRKTLESGLFGDWWADSKKLFVSKKKQGPEEE